MALKRLLAISVLVFGWHSAVAQGNVGMYYVSGRPGDHGIWISVRDSLGRWPRGDRVLLNGIFDGDAVDPDVVRLDDGAYRMYYFKGYFVTPPPPNAGLHKIYSADSKDGRNYSVNGIAFEYQNITDPSVVKLNNGEYLMACTQMSGTQVQTVVARSTNGGLNFNYVTTVQNTGIPELYALGDGSVRLFYNGPGGIVSKRSFDNGKTWHSEAGTRLAHREFVADPGVVQTADNQWWLFVKGFNGNGNKGPAGHKIMLAQSTDATNSFAIVQNLLLDSASVPEGVVMRPLTTDAQSADVSENFALYPNPFSEQAVGQTRVPLKNAVLTVHNSLGHAVKEIRNIHGHRFTLSRAKLSNGLYFLRLTEENKVIAVGKLVITD